MRSPLTAASVFVFLLANTEAAAEPASPPGRVYVQTLAPRLLCAPPAPPTRCRELPPGRFLDERSFAAVDAELRRAQDAATRLAAENAALRKASAAWRPGWRSLTSVLATGLALGAYVASRF